MDEPVTARSAAEAVRTPNHLTLFRPAALTPGCEDFADVDAIAGELRIPACGGGRSLARGRARS